MVKTCVQWHLTPIAHRAAIKRPREVCRAAPLRATLLVAALRRQKPRLPLALVSYRPLAAPRFSFGHEAHAPRDRAEMSADLLKSFGAELLAALPQGRPAADELAAPTAKAAKSGGSAMRSAAEELEVARTLRDSGDLAGAEETLLAVAGAARTRAAETLSTRELYTVIRASAGLAEVSVARDDWAAAEDAVKLALAASEALAPKWRTARDARCEAARRRRRRFRVTPTRRGLSSPGPRACCARRLGRGSKKAARSAARLRKALDARAPLAALSPNVRRALSVGAAKPAPRAAWPLQSAAVARVASFLAVRDAARFSVCAKATASAVDVATRRDLRRVHGEATPPRRRADAADDSLRLLRRARGQGDDTTVRPRAAHELPRRVAAAGRRHVSALQGAGRS